MDHTLNIIWFSPQIGDLLGTSLLAMAFLALEEMGIYYKWKWFLCRLCNKDRLKLPIPWQKWYFPQETRVWTTWSTSITTPLITTTRWKGWVLPLSTLCKRFNQISNLLIPIQIQSKINQISNLLIPGNWASCVPSRWAHHPQPSLNTLSLCPPAF